ncbi:hypothetical protein, partial [Ramlibacter sp.]|uniref:hypothetical protein n=1 Tax=Ramlibacter sp. TaxID=1917967 RepID=UPI0026194E4B
GRVIERRVWLRSSQTRSEFGRAGRKTGQRRFARSRLARSGRPVARRSPPACGFAAQVAVVAD